MKDGNWIFCIQKVPKVNFHEAEEKHCRGDRV